MIKRNSLVALLVVLLSVSLESVRAADYGEPLRQAEALLSKGEYAGAYAAYLEQARTAKNPLAAFNLALFHVYGWGMPVDKVQACDWYRQAAEGSVPAASHAYGECLEQGIGRPVDKSAAARWYGTAARLGHFYSLCALARLTMDGEGAPRDPAQAVALCRSAAERGSPPAMLDLGRFLLEGDESVRDPAEAAAWFRQAVESGEHEAAWFLARQFEEGLGVAKDLLIAAQWYEYLAAKGERRAYLKAGESYWLGPRDPVSGRLPAEQLAKAYLWLSAALRAGEDEQRAEAGRLLSELEQVMPATWKVDLDARVSAHLNR